MEKIMFTWWNFQRYLKSQKGQGMVEYILVVGLVGLGCVVAMQETATGIGTKFTELVKKITDTKL